MSAAEPEDDGIDRWLVHHYRYDPERHERRNVVVAAFDNEQEFHLEIAKRAAVLRAGQTSGTRDVGEQISGVAHPVGSLAEAARGHAIRSAIEHGATVAVTTILEGGSD